MRWIVLITLLFILCGCRLQTIIYHGDISYGQNEKAAQVNAWEGEQEGEHWEIRLGTSWKFRVNP